ncbi:MAG: thiamine pyrophosphate-requiring protein [Tepidisphaeraceae bacterium]
MAQTVSDFLVQRLQQWNVERLYAYPGDGTAGIEAALRKAENQPKFIQARHEELCAFMACAHAKFTGEVGVCLATSGPGAIHLLNGLYDAKMDHQPVVAIVGQAATTAMGSHYQQEVDLQNLFKDVASEYVTTVTSPAAAQHAIDRAFRISMDQKTVTCLIFPKDIQEMSFEEPKQSHNYAISSIAQGHTHPRIVPNDQELQAAAAVLNDGKKVAVLVGQGAIGATDEVIAITDLLGGGVAKSWLGKAVVPDDVPFCTNSIGLLGTKASWDLMQECDTLLIVGCNFPYAEFYPKLGQAKAVQIDVDGRMLALRYPIDVALKGDARDTLQALQPLLKRKEDRAWQEQIVKAAADSWEQTKAMAANSASRAGLINPERVFTELSPLLPDRCILSADSGTAANWYARDLKIRRGMMASGSGNLATMGPAVPYAVAAKFCFPDRVAIALTGDGAMQMNGLNACITVAKYWKEWSDPRWICLVLNNRDLNQVTWEQRAMTGDIKFDASQDLPDFPYAAYADSIGLQGIRVDDPDQVADAWKRALLSDRPVVLECITDPDTPTLPPHITLEQAKKFTQSLLKVDPHEGGVIKQAMKGMVTSFLPGT